MSYFRNKDELVRGRSALREVLLGIAESALRAADPYIAARSSLSFDGEALIAGGRQFPLLSENRIFVIGAGKATFPIARALEDILGERIYKGLAVCKHGQEGSLSRIDLRSAAHPLPDAESYRSAVAMQELLKEVKPGDVVIACFTGGSSSLFVDPVPGISLEDKASTGRTLLTCGANIIEINAVRKHLSRVKGGRLVKPLPPGVRLINLTVSDVIGDALDYLCDPSVPDTSSFEDACRTLDKYELWAKLPASVTKHLRAAPPELRTMRPTDLAHLNRHDIIMMRGDAACQAAAAEASARGLTPVLLSTSFEGESREVGRSFAAIARQIEADGNPARSPCLLIGGGETTVFVPPGICGGKGGPNQEFAVAVALEVAGDKRIAALGLDTDGTDGPTRYAGALIDGTTVSTARQHGIDMQRSLALHDVTPALEAAGDIVLTGATGTNVNDLKLVLVDGPSRSP
jgi:glycerate-2-kinase